MRLVLDTDVVVAAVRSPSGASSAILEEALAGNVTLLLTVPLAFEYEAICNRTEHRVAGGLSAQDARLFIEGIVALCEPVRVSFLWRPQLRDANDEMVLEAAVNGGADAIVTFNLRDFGGKPKQFGIDLLLPRDALAQIRRVNGETKGREQ